jgi:hypothetical protein
MPTRPLGEADKGDPLAFDFSLDVISPLPISSRNSSHSDKLKNTTKDFFSSLYLKRSRI